MSQRNVTLLPDVLHDTDTRHIVPVKNSTWLIGISLEGKVDDTSMMYPFHNFVNLILACNAKYNRAGSSVIRRFQRNSLVSEGNKILLRNGTKAKILADSRLQVEVKEKLRSLFIYNMRIVFYNDSRSWSLPSLSTTIIWSSRAVMNVSNVIRMCICICMIVFFKILIFQLTYSNYEKTI